MKVTLSLLLARDYFRLGRESDAAAMLDKVVPVTEGQRAEIADIRRLFQKTTGLVADIAQRRKDHQSVAASAIDLSSCYLELGDARSALSVLEQELQRRKEHSEYDLLRMREAIAGAYMHLKDYQKAEEVSRTLVKPYADHIGNLEWPGVTDHLNATVYYLCYCYLCDGRYEKCADLGDRWAKHRDANANFPGLREEIDVRRANAYRHVGRLSDAEKVYKSVAVHTDMSLPATQKNYCSVAYSAGANDGLACTYYRQAKYQAALKHAKISIELNAKVNNNVECAFSKLVLAQCLQKLNRSAEASILKAEALKVLQTTRQDILRSHAYFCDDVVSLDSICPQSLRAPKIRH